MQVILICFAVAGLMNLLYFLGFLKFSQKKESANIPDVKIFPVSVIICAKNEAENLKNFLPSILSQDHPQYEIVVINDASTDETLDVLEDFQRRDARIKIANVQNNEAFWANKKYALTLGIKKAANPYLLFTDADCQPVSDQWITEMTKNFQDGQIILGYGGYFKKNVSLLNKLIRFETLLTAVQYFSYAEWGIPYMGVGRNLAYTSDEFYGQNGFATHLHLRSGDDDLFVNQAAHKLNTTTCFSSNSITRSIPKQNLKDWFQQKKRHVSVARNYKIKHRILLSLFYLSQISFWILLIILLFSSFWEIALAVLFLRLLIQGTVFYNAGKKLDERDLIWFFPFLEFFLISAQLGIFISNTISKPNHWK